MVNPNREARKEFHRIDLQNELLRGRFPFSLPASWNSPPDMRKINKEKIEHHSY